MAREVFVAGSGPATGKSAIARERAPVLSVEGPIQYDAAVDAGVAATKLPDLNTGNNTYKAVQRNPVAITAIQAQEDSA